MTDFDLAIIGAGPAGMSAAITARTFGLRVAVFDEKPSPGGQIYAGIDGHDPQHSRAFITALGHDYASGAALITEFRNCGAHYLPQASVWHASSDGRIAYTHPRAQPGTGDSSQRATATRILIATGAQERPAPLRGWTLPGVMGVGGAQLMLKGARMIPAAPIVIVGSGPLALLYGAQLQALGGAVSAYVEPTGATQKMAALKYGFSALRGARYLAKGAGLLAQRAWRSAKVYRNATDIEINGEESVRGVQFNWHARRVQLPARTVLLHDGIVPQLQLSRLLELEHRWHECGNYQMPVTDRHGRSSQSTIFIAGDGRRIDGAHAARHSGALAALAAVIDLHPQQQQQAQAQLEQHAARLHRETAVRPFLDTLYPAAQWPFDNLAGDTIACRCENITVAAIQDSCRAAIDNADRMKALHRCGMGPCQGRMCEYSVAMIAARVLDCHPSQFGLHRIREPIKPISLAALAALPPAGIVK